MAEIALSDAERIFVVHGIQDNLRTDGRSFDDYRPIDLETSVISTASGSARVKLGNTQTLCGIKADLVQANESAEDVGKLEFFIDCSANADPVFEGRGGEELAMEMSNFLSSAYKSSFDHKQLCVLKGKQYWLLHIDILILECGGNLLDAVSIAIKAALFNTKIPKITVSLGDGGKEELEISDDPFDVQRLDVTQLPIVVTLNKVGHKHIVDATMEEENCSLARLHVAVTKDGQSVAMHKSGGGSLGPASLFNMLETAETLGPKLNEALISKLKEEETIVPSDCSGFLK